MPAVCSPKNINWYNTPSSILFSINFGVPSIVWNKMPSNRPKSCFLCRQQKRRCDLQIRRNDRENSCSTCAEKGRECVFDEIPARKRPRLTFPDPTLLGEHPMPSETTPNMDTVPQGTSDQPSSPFVPLSLSRPGSSATRVRLPNAESFGSHTHTPDDPVSWEGQSFLRNLFCGKFSQQPSANQSPTTACANIRTSNSPENPECTLRLPRELRCYTRSDAFKSARHQIFQAVVSSS